LGCDEMPTRVSVELDLPDDVATGLASEDVAAMAKEALVMELLREHRISQGKAAEILNISRSELFAVMSRHRVPVIEMTSAELVSELQAPIPER
jgi:predicted HTH domain antitoxin